MSRTFFSRISVLLTATACLVLAVAPSISIGAEVLFEGGFAEKQLNWEAMADGVFRPGLADAALLEETDRPVLAVKDLNLLIPIDMPVIGVEIIPLATHLEKVPGLLASGQAALTDKGVSVKQGRLEEGKDFFPVVWGEFSGVNVWRGFATVGVRVYPLRAVRGDSGQWDTVEVLDRYEVRPILGDASDLPDMATRRRLVAGERQETEAVLRELCDNPNVLGGYVRNDGIAISEPTGGFAPSKTPTLTGSTVSCLIITSNTLAAEFQRLADFRTGQGLPSVVATTEWIEDNYRNGSDLQETIRMFIREAYENWGVEFVLLGGDTDVVPPRWIHDDYYAEPPALYTEIPADIYFSCLDGNWNADGDAYFGEYYRSFLYPGDDPDFLSEIALGRATVSTVPAVSSFVDKVIQYETAEAGDSWTGEHLFATEVLFPNPWVSGDPYSLDGAGYAEQIIAGSIELCSDMNYVRMYETYYEYPGSVDLNVASFIDSLNSGNYGIVSQIGHGFFFNMSVGDGNLTNADADALINDNYFVLYALNCASGAFDQSCLLERFVQNTHGGSVASLGSARAAFPATASEFQEDFFESLYCGNEHRLGQLVNMSRLAFVAAAYGRSSERWTLLNYTLLGDPALMVWSGTTAAPLVSAPGSLIAGSQSVVIDVTSGGNPVPGVRVGLRKDGEDYAWSDTDGSGSASLDFSPVTSGDATLSIHGENLEFSTQTIGVSVPSSFIASRGLGVVDNGTSGSVGNGNGVPEAGETVALFLDVEDTGGGGATGCQAVLGTLESGISILVPSVALGDIGPGQTETGAVPFVVQLDPAIIDGTEFRFSVTVTDAAKAVYVSNAAINVRAPEIEPVALAWSDIDFGNGDGLITVGERATVLLDIKNYGVGRADLVTATLRTLDATITLNDSVVTYADLELMDENDGTGFFSFTLSSLARTPEFWILGEDNHGRTFRHDFIPGMPATPENVESDPSGGPDVIMLQWTPVIDDDSGIRGYHVYRASNQVGPWTRANADLIDRVAYFRDSGLNLLTEYHYRVTAVDSNLVEGQPSLGISQSTAPPEAGSFPLPFGSETSGHCVLGDLNADGIREIVLGADEIYVWSSNGEEMIDGDNNAQTFGPLTDLNGNFQPGGIALANLDGNPGLEVVVGDHATEMMHVFCHDGTEAPGWPKAMSSWNWTTPAIGDIDGDGDMEVVVNTIDTRTWAWHHDGTEVLDGDSDPATDGVFVERDWPYDEWGYSSPAIFDIDGDGAGEVIFGTKYGWNAAGSLLAYRYDGTQPAGFPYALGLEGVLSSPLVADLNNDGVWEIVFSTNHSDNLHVVQQDGTAYPGFPIHLDNNINTAPTPSPAVGDFDDDGELEIVAISQVSGSQAYVYVYDTDVGGGTSGTVLTGWPQFIPGSSEGSPVVGDINGDGLPDVIHGIGGASEDAPNNLFAFNNTGGSIPGFPITLGGPLRPSAIITDFEGDGDVDIIFGGGDMLIHVWDMPDAYNGRNVPWGTFRGHFYRDGVYRDPDSTVAVPQEIPSREFFLAKPFPNPFNPSTTITLFVPENAGASVDLDVRIFDLKGRMVKVLQSGPGTAGPNTWTWNGCDSSGCRQASGMYFVRARSGEFTAMQKLSLIK